MEKRRHLGTFSPPSWGSFFDVFSLFLVFFSTFFFDVFLEGLRAPVWEDFGMILGMVVGVFSEKMWGAWPCKKHRFDVVFVMFQAQWPFQKKLEK